MSNLLPYHSEETLIDLYHAVVGKVGKFVDATAAKHQCLFCLERNEIVKIETTIDEYTGKRLRRAALTKHGKKFAESAAINAPDRLPKIPALMPKASEESRISIYFQLNLKKSDHVETLRRVKSLKRAGRFNPTIRHLLELEETLGIETLDAFKAARDALETEMQKLSELRNALDERERELDRQWEELEAERAHDETLLDVKDKLVHLEGLLKNGAVAQNVPAAGPRQLNVGRVPVTNFADDDDEPLLEVKKDESAGKRATENFLRSMMALQEKPEEKEPTAAGPKQLTVAAFDKPVFDDEDDDIGFSIAAAGD